MKEFNLEDAKAGKPVCTRDGREVELLKFDARGKRPLVGILKGKEEDDVSFWYINGRTWVDRERPDDLMMASESEKNEGWINIIYDPQEKYYTPAYRLFESKEEAESKMYNEFQRVATIHIEW